MNPQIPLSKEEIKQFCQKWKIRELCLFGSILRDDFTADSDIDLLVSFAADAQWSLLNFMTMEYELETLLKREVDLVVKETIENSDNWLRKQTIVNYH